MFFKFPKGKTDTKKNSKAIRILVIREPWARSTQILNLVENSD